MTLIAFATHDDRAEILTDTWAYLPNGRVFGRSTKVHTIAHLDTAVLTQGDRAFTSTWLQMVEESEADAASFDDLLAWIGTSGQRLAALWSAMTGPHTTREVTPSALFHVGYSPARERFVAIAHASHDNFAPHEIPGLYVMPAPLVMRPGYIELDRFRADMDDEPRENDAENLAALEALPVDVPAPETLDQWISLAAQARRTRSTLPTSTRLKVFVGGTLQFTHLGRGSVATTTIGEFADDNVEEMAAIFAGTMHPLGQAAPCPCGSGQTYAACHLAEHADEPCLCGSGVAMRDCCLIPAPAPKSTSVSEDRATVMSSAR